MKRETKVKKSIAITCADNGHQGVISGHQKEEVTHSQFEHGKHFSVSHMARFTWI